MIEQVSDAPAVRLLPRRRTRRRRAAFAIAALLLGAAAGLAVVETGLRMVNPQGVKERASWHFMLWEGIRPSANAEKVWEHVPGYRARLVGYDVAINSLGFRGDEIAPAKTPGAFRILALGDSMTFGMSVGQSDCYPAQLQAMLRARNPGASIEVVNAGVLGYTTLQEEALLREALPLLEPDAVVLWWHWNDVELTGAANPATPAEELSGILGYKERNWKRSAIHAGYEIAPCSVALVRAITVGRSDLARAAEKIDPASRPEGWAANADSLRRIAKFCEESSTPFALYGFGRYEPIAEICAELKIPYITAVATDGLQEAEAYAVSIADPHFTRKGNEQVAKTIAALLDSMLPALRAPNRPY